MNYDQATEKLLRYHREAEVQRQLPKHAWRTELAQLLRRVAERLEAAPAAVTS